MGKTTKAFAEMPGMLRDVPLFTTKPPRPASATSLRQAAAVAYASGRSEPTQRASSAASTRGDLRNDLLLEALDEAPSSAADTSQEGAARPRVVHVRRTSGKPFSNYQKYDAMRTALKSHTIHVTSVGPYISKVEQRNLDEQDKRAKSIHGDNFKPGGLWDKWEPPPGGWGFAAAGFLLPDDLPQTARRFGSFYNTHAHQFRATKPKENLYM